MNNIIGQFVARLEVVESTSPPIHDHLRFEMALQTDGVAFARDKLVGIENGSAAMLRNMLRCVAMASFAGYAAIQERHCGVAITCLRERRLHATGMAMQAAAVHREGERHFCGLLVVRRHVPYAFFGIPIDRYFEPVALSLKEKGAPALAGAEEVEQFFFAFDRRLLRSRRTLVGQVDSAIS